jgi:hypothetical protein
MRHVFLPGPIAAGTRCMGQATAATTLITAASRALGMPACLRGTPARAVDLAAIAAAADQHLSLAAHTYEQPRRCFQRCAFCRAWTMTVMSGIVPRHACSRTMWGTASIRTWRFRSAPRLPILAAVTTPFVPLNSRRDSLGCGYVDNARALPTYPQPNNNSSSQLQFDFGAAAITGRTFASRRRYHGVAPSMRAS